MDWDQWVQDGRYSVNALFGIGVGLTVMLGAVLFSPETTTVTPGSIIDQVGTDKLMVVLAIGPMLVVGILIRWYRSIPKS